MKRTEELPLRSKVDRSETPDYDLPIYRAIIDSLGEGAVAIDEGGMVRFANPAALEILGYQTLGGIEGQNFHHLVHSTGTCKDAARCALWHGLDHSADIRTQDDKFVRADGVFVPVVFTLTRLEVDGLDEGAVVAFRDMSKYRHIHAQFLLTDRMAAVGTLAAGVAHEINNPLAYVQANVNFVLRELEKRSVGEETSVDHAELVEALEDGLEGIGRMRSIVDGMQAFTGGEGRSGQVDLEACLQDALTVCHGEIKRYAQIQRTGQPLQFVRGNALQLRQVFVNLLLNAASAVEASGNFGAVAITTRVEGEEQFVEIADDGVGIKQDALKEIFDPFFTLGEVGDGSGLGLYVARAILSELGGGITVESIVGVGTTFVINLPCLDEQG